IVVTRERGGVRVPARLVPRALPLATLRFNTVMLAIAIAFLLLGGWVWRERRDRLTRTFYLLSLALAVQVAPPPRFGSRPAETAYSYVLVVAQLFIGPLFSHFFALFPESGRSRARVWVLGLYAAATVLLACFTGVVVGSLLAPSRPLTLPFFLRQVAPGLLY